MKLTRCISTSLIVLSSAITLGQNVGINSTGATPNASAGLDIDFTNRGVLIPRVALTATNSAVPITTPATSLLVYNTATAGAGTTAVSPGYYYWDGAAWVRFSMDGNDWRILGNAGTNPAVHFIGTTDAVDFVVRTSNVERMRVLSGGNVGIGTATPSNRLTVFGGNVLITDAVNQGGFIQGFDEHHSIYFREGGINRSNYYQFGGTLAAGNGHRFLTGGLRTAQTLRFQIADNASVNFNPFGIGPATTPLGVLDVNLNGVSNYAYFRQNVTGGNPSTAFTQGLAIGWNRTNGQGESNIIFSSSTGSATGLEIGDWNGTVYRPHVKIMAITGNTGIGVINATNKLDVAQAARSGTHGTNLPFYVTGTVANGSVGATGFEFRHDNGSQGIGLGYNTIYATGSNPSQDLGFSALGPGGSLIYNTFGTEKMRVLPNGNVGIGTPNPTNKLQVHIGYIEISDNFDNVLLSRNTAQGRNFQLIGTAMGWDQTGIYLGGYNQNNPGGAYSSATRIYAGGQYGSLPISATAFTVVSSKRFKQNIQPVAYGLDAVLKMRPVQYDYIFEKSHQVHLGLIAEEMNQLIPEVVVKQDKNGQETTDVNGTTMGINYTDLTPVLIKAIQEQQAQIEALNKKIEVLEKELQNKK